MTEYIYLVMSKPIFASDSDAIPTWFLLCRVLRGEIPLPPELHPGPIPENYDSNDEYDSPSNDVGEIWTDPEYTVADVATYHAVNDEEDGDHITEMTYTTAMQQEMMGNESEEDDDDDDDDDDDETWMEDDIGRALRKLQQLFESKLTDNGTRVLDSSITTKGLGFVISCIRKHPTNLGNNKWMATDIYWNDIAEDIEHHTDTLTSIVVTGYNHVSLTIHTTISQCYGWLCNDGIIKPLSWHLNMKNATRSGSTLQERCCEQCDIYEVIIHDHDWVASVKNKVRDYIVNNDIVAMFPMIEFHPQFRRDGAKVVGDMLYDEELLPVPQGVAAIIGGYAADNVTP